MLLQAKLYYVEKEPVYYRSNLTPIDEIFAVFVKRACFKVK